MECLVSRYASVCGRILRGCRTGLALAAVITTGCADAPPTPQTGLEAAETSPSGEVLEKDRMDVCALLTAEEYESVMGGKPESVQPDEVGSFKTCAFNSERDTAGALIAAARAQESEFDRSLESERKIGAQQPRHLPEVAAKAYWLPQSGLVVGYKNGVFFRVMANTHINPEERSTALAARVVRNIP